MVHGGARWRTDSAAGDAVAGDGDGGAPRTGHFGALRTKDPARPRHRIMRPDSTTTNRFLQEITALLMVVNLVRFNAAFAIGPAGFSDGMVCVLARS